MDPASPPGRGAIIDVHQDLEATGDSSSSMSSIPYLIDEHPRSHNGDHPDRLNLHSQLYERTMQLGEVGRSRGYPERPSFHQLYSFEDPYFHETPYVLNYSTNPPQILEYVFGGLPSLPPGHYAPWSEVPPEQLAPLAIADFPDETLLPLPEVTAEKVDVQEEAQLGEWRKDPEWPLWKMPEPPGASHLRYGRNIFETDTVSTRNTTLLERDPHRNGDIFILDRHVEVDHEENRIKPEKVQWSPVWLIALLFGIVILAALVVELYFIVKYATTGSL